MRKLPALFSGRRVIITTTNIFPKIQRLFKQITSSSSSPGIFNHDCANRIWDTGRGGDYMSVPNDDSLSAIGTARHSTQTGSTTHFYSGGPASNLVVQANLCGGRFLQGQYESLFCFIVKTLLFRFRSLVNSLYSVSYCH